MDNIIQEAHERFSLADAYESQNRLEARDDLNMLAGRGHWASEILQKRKMENRPCLTINKLPSFVDQVTNDGRLSKVGIVVRPYGSGASKKIAKLYNGIIRNIQNTSNAEIAFQTALEGAANNGFGYFRVVTDYADDSTFDQEIHLRRIRNCFSVYLDPAHVEFDGRDIKWAFITEMMARYEAEAQHPNVEITPFEPGMSDSLLSWITKDQVRVAEYWKKVPITRKLYLLSDERTVYAEEWDKVRDELGENAPRILKERTVDTHKVVQYLLGGDQIISGPHDWLGKYIPIIPVWGKEIIIDDERLLRGVIRFAKDPQRMYNYFRTAATETVALAPKAPYMVEEGQIKGHENEWNELGRENKPYIVYKRVAGLQAPKREVVSQTAIGEITESGLANDEMKATTSLFDASLGAQGNEVSGRAIKSRQFRGELANYAYHDNLRHAVEFCGDILLDLIPKVFDTERQILVTDEKERETMITVNQIVRDEDTGEDVIINDLSQGKYKVTATVGQSYATKRMEAAESMLDFVRTAPAIAGYIIDLVAKNMDWPGAEEIAARLRMFLGIDEEGNMQPKQPSLDEIVKKLKAQSIDLGNVKKKLDIVEQKRGLTGYSEQMVQAGATGALQAMGVGGGENEGG